MPNIFHNSLSLGYSVAAGGPPSGYIALWRFENNVNEDTGTYSATAYGSPSYSTGKVGSYCINTASGKYVTTNLPRSIFENNNFSISIWINYTTTSRGKVLMASDAGGGYGIGVNESGNGKIFIDMPLYSPSHCYCESSNAYNNGNWHLVIMTWNQSTKTLTLDIDNGTENKTKSATDNPTIKTAPLTFGRHGTYNGVYYIGSMDQCYIYPKVLTTAEIAQLWNSGSGI